MRNGSRARAAPRRSGLAGSGSWSVSADADILGEELDDAHEAKLHLMLEGRAARMCTSRRSCVSLQTTTGSRSGRRRAKSPRVRCKRD